MGDYLYIQADSGQILIIFLQSPADRLIDRSAELIKLFRSQILYKGCHRSSAPGTLYCFIPAAGSIFFFRTAAVAFIPVSEVDIIKYNSVKEASFLIEIPVYMHFSGNDILPVLREVDIVMSGAVNKRPASN